MEHKVKQRTKEWHKLRKNVALTASQFADAVGVGSGKPFHFLQSLIENDEENNEPEEDSVRFEALRHGVKMESIIREAYELLTGISQTFSV